MRKTEPAAILETCRKSTISFNFDFDNESDDIMSSVLAVMDKLKNVRLSEGIGFTYLTKCLLIGKFLRKFVKPDQKCRTCIMKSESMMKESCF